MGGEEDPEEPHYGYDLRIGDIYFNRIWDLYFYRIWYLYFNRMDLQIQSRDTQAGVVFWLLEAYAPFILKYIFDKFQMLKI
jgi:hypothetical protein